MTIERVRNPDPRVAAYSHLSDADLLQFHGLFAEGRLVVRRIIEDGRCTVKSLLVNKGGGAESRALLATLGDRVPIFSVSGDFLGFTATTSTAVASLVERPPRSPSTPSTR